MRSLRSSSASNFVSLSRRPISADWYHSEQLMGARVTRKSGRNGTREMEIVIKNEHKKRRRRELIWRNERKWRWFINCIRGDFWTRDDDGAGGELLKLINSWWKKEIAFEEHFRDQGRLEAIVMFLDDDKNAHYGKESSREMVQGCNLKIVHILRFWEKSG